MVTDSTSQTDDTASFLRAARSGNLERVIEFLDQNLDINTANSNGLNALHLASKDGHIEIVTELLKRGAKVDAATKKGNTALHIASLAGQEEIVNILIQYGAAVNIQSQNGFTPLYMAAQENHDQVVKLLLNNGANQSLATEDGFTPLAVAMQQGHDKVVSVLLENDSKGKVRLPALHIAARKDDCKAADLLLQNDHKPDVTSKSGFTPLHIAAHYGNEDIARLLIKRGADVNYLAKHNISPLHVAAKWGKNNLVKILLENSAIIDAKTRDGLTPLHCAARSGHEQVISTLLEHSAPISARTKNGLAPLHMASQGDHVGAARVLLYHRAPVDEVTIDYLTSLHVAAHCGHVRVAKLLLDRKADPNARALNGFTPLHIACKKNRIKVVELLLKHGASIESTTESGLTPLHVASFMGCMNIVIFLLQHEANPDVPTVRGETPLHLAARANQTDIIRILLRNGAKVDARARELQTPLHIAARLGNVDIVMLLLQHGAAVDTATKDMYTALHVASKEGQEEVAAILLDNNASINATTTNGFTPLHFAAKYGNMNVAKLLLQRGGELETQDKHGITPIHLACHYDHPNVAQLLLDKGASPHTQSQNGHTPLHIVARKNQMDIATTLIEHGANANVQSRAGFTPLHLSAQKGHYDMTNLLIEHGADPNKQAKNGLSALHLCAQEDFTKVASVLVKHGADVGSKTVTGYRPIHVAAHFGNLSMIRFLLKHNAEIDVKTSQSYTPLHQAAQQGHAHVVSALIEANAWHRARTNDGLTALNIAQKLGYISVMEVLKGLSYDGITPDNKNWEEKYKVIAPESLQETSLMSDSDDEGGSDALISEQPYQYLTVDLMKSLQDDSLPIDVTGDDPSHKQLLKQEKHEFVQSNNYCLAESFDESTSMGKLHFKPFLVSFLVDARGGAMKGCRHSGIRIIIPPRRATMPIRVTCKLIKPSKIPNPPPQMDGEALATRIVEMGPVGASFLGPVLIDLPHSASISGKEREIIILRSDNGETWKEHDNSADNDDTLLSTPYDTQMSASYPNRITRIITSDFPQYFAVLTRIRQEVHVIGAEGGILISSVAEHVQAVFPPGALTKKIKVGLQAHVIPAELTAKLLGNCVAVSPVVTIEPRRRKFHKPITITMPVPRAANKGMINQYGGETPTLRLLYSIAGGTSEAQWEDVTGSTPLTFMNDRISFTTTVSARFLLIDYRNSHEVPKMATELYKESLFVPYITNFVIYSKRMDIVEATLRILCMTDGKEGVHTLEKQEEFTEIVKSRDVEALDGKDLYIEFSGNLVPVTKSGVQLKFTFRAFRQNRLSFHVKVKDPLLDPVARMLFMREPKVAKGEPSQQPICVLNILLPETVCTKARQKKSEDVEDSNITSQKMDLLKTKYETDRDEKCDQPKSASPSEKKFITDTLQKEHTDAATIHDSLAQKAACSLESVDASYPNKVVAQDDASPGIENQTYSEKRKFWEDIARKRDSYQRSESEVSKASQLTFNESDSDYLQNIISEDDTEANSRRSDIPEDSTVPDISECSVAEKAHYFEEQIQKEMSAVRVPARKQSQTTEGPARKADEPEVVASSSKLIDEELDREMVEDRQKVAALEESQKKYDSTEEIKKGAGVTEKKIPEKEGILEEDVKGKYDSTDEFKKFEKTEQTKEEDIKNEEKIMISQENIKKKGIGVETVKESVEKINKEISEKDDMLMTVDTKDKDVIISLHEVKKDSMEKIVKDMQKTESVDVQKDEQLMKTSLKEKECIIFPSEFEKKDISMKKVEEEFEKPATVSSEIHDVLTKKAGDMEKMDVVHKVEEKDVCVEKIETKVEKSESVKLDKDVTIKKEVTHDKETTAPLHDFKERDITVEKLVESSEKPVILRAEKDVKVKEERTEDKEKATSLHKLEKIDVKDIIKDVGKIESKSVQKDEEVIKEDITEKTMSSLEFEKEDIQSREITTPSHDLKEKDVTEEKLVQRIEKPEMTETDKDAKSGECIDDEEKVIPLRELKKEDTNVKGMTKDVEKIESMDIEKREKVIREDILEKVIPSREIKEEDISAQQIREDVEKIQNKFTEKDDKVSHENEQKKDISSSLTKGTVKDTEKFESKIPRKVEKMTKRDDNKTKETSAPSHVVEGVLKKGDMEGKETIVPLPPLKKEDITVEETVKESEKIEDLGKIEGITKECISSKEVISPSQDLKKEAITTEKIKEDVKEVESVTETEIKILKSDDTQVSTVITTKIEEKTISEPVVVTTKSTEELEEDEELKALKTRAEDEIQRMFTTKIEEKRISQQKDEEVQLHMELTSEVEPSVLKTVKKEFESRIPISVSMAEKEKIHRAKERGDEQEIKKPPAELEKKKEFESRIPKLVSDTRKSVGKDFEKKEFGSYTVTKEQTKEVKSETYQEHSTKTKSDIFSFTPDFGKSRKMFDEAQALIDKSSNIVSTVDRKEVTTREEKEIKSSEISKGTDTYVLHEEKEHVAKKETQASSLMKQSPEETIREEEKKIKESDMTTAQRTSMNITDEKEVIDATVSGTTVQSKESKVFKLQEDKDKVVIEESDVNKVKEKNIDITMKIENDLTQSKDSAIGENIIDSKNVKERTVQENSSEQHFKFVDRKVDLKARPQTLIPEKGFKREDNSLNKGSIDEFVAEEQKLLVEESEARGIAETIVQSIESEIQKRAFIPGQPLAELNVSTGTLLERTQDTACTEDLDRDKLADDLTQKFETLLHQDSETSSLAHEPVLEKDLTRDSASFSEDISRDDESSLQIKDDSCALSSSQVRLQDRDITISPSSISDQVELEDTDVLTNYIENASKSLKSGYSEKQTPRMSSPSEYPETEEEPYDLEKDKTLPKEAMYSEMSGAKVLGIVEPEIHSRQDSMDVPSLEIDDVRFTERISQDNSLPREEERKDSNRSSFHESATVDSLEKMCPERDITISPSTISEGTNIEYSLSHERMSIGCKGRKGDSFEINSPPMISPRSKVKELEIKPVDWMIGDEKIEISETLQPSQAFDKELEEYQSTTQQKDFVEDDYNTFEQTEFDATKEMQTSASDTDVTQKSVLREPKPSIVKSKFSVIPISEQDLEKELIENKLEMSCQELVDTLQREYESKTPTKDDQLENIRMFKDDRTIVSDEEGSEGESMSAVKSETQSQPDSFDAVLLDDEEQRTLESSLKNTSMETDKDKSKETKTEEETYDELSERDKPDSPQLSRVDVDKDTQKMQEAKGEAKPKRWDESLTARVKLTEEHKRLGEKMPDKRDRPGQSDVSAFKITKEDLQNVDLSAKYAITVLDQVVKKEIAEVKESLEAAKQDLIDELSENSETVFQIKDSPSEFQFKLQPEPIPNDLPFLYRAPSSEHEADHDSVASTDSPVAKPRKQHATSDTKESPGTVDVIASDVPETKKDVPERTSDIPETSKDILETAKGVLEAAKEVSETAKEVSETAKEEEEVESTSKEEITETITVTAETEPKVTVLKESKVETPSPIPASRSGSEGENKDENFTLLSPQPVPRRRQKPARASKKITSESEAESSGESSQYQSCEYDIGSGSRPSSSDIEALQSTLPSGTYSEYETAPMSAEHSSDTRATSQDYHTAASSLSSRESMKSLNSLSSGHLGSIDSTGELSETLVASEADADKDELDENLEHALDEDNVDDEYDYKNDNANVETLDDDIPCGMKRSSEMIFQQISEDTTTLEEQEEADDLEYKSIRPSAAEKSMEGAIVEKDFGETRDIDEYPSQVTVEKSEERSMSPLETYSPERKLSTSNMDDEMVETSQTPTASLFQQASMSTSSTSAISIETIVDKDKMDRRSPDSDSFELVDKPDIIDDFVVIEEVGREAEEFDSEGKSIRIGAMSYSGSKNYDREVENLLRETQEEEQARASSVRASGNTEVFDFETEESPPQASNEDQYSQSYSDEEQYEGNKKWIEMQFQSDTRLYDIEYDRGPLEDIKEEEITDFEAGSSRFGSLGSHKESIGSVGSMRGSFGSTPDYDSVATRKYFIKPTDHDNVSLSSLQEFEHLESTVAMENARKLQCGSQDSSSNNGSLPRRYTTSRSGYGDDISLSSLKDFEGLESACREAHLIELRAREEQELLDHESPENRYKLEMARAKTDSSTAGSVNPSTSGSDDYEKRIKEIDEIIRIAQINVEKLERQDDTTEDISQLEITDMDRGIATVAPVETDNARLLEEVNVIESNIAEANVMETSTDSLELEDNNDKKYNPLCRSSDSLEMKTTLDFPSLSSDSLNNVRDPREGQLDSSDRYNTSRRISSDSLELPVLDPRDLEAKAQSKDKEDESHVAGSERSVVGDGNESSSESHVGRHEKTKSHETSGT